MTVLSSQQEIEILITEAEIAARTTQLARIISDHYRGTRQLVVVGLLRGSFVFTADLVRRIDLPVEVGFHDGIFLRRQKGLVPSGANHSGYGNRD